MHRYIFLFSFSPQFNSNLDVFKCFKSELAVLLCHNSGTSQCSCNWSICPGGGALHLTSTGLGLIDGQVSARGGNAGTYGGGGSGGSLILNNMWFEGWGLVQADGGDTHGRTGHCVRVGGGGGGGRIKTFSPTGVSKPVFWQRTVKGGSSPSYPGGAGTLCPITSMAYFQYFTTSDEMADCACTSDSQAKAAAQRQHLCSSSGNYNETTSSCECDAGFVGFACQYECDGATTCNGRGVCDGEDGCCVCDEGFVGLRCEHACDARFDCHGNGKCNDMGECECDPCYNGDKCQFFCGKNVSDPFAAQRGRCLDDQCHCDSCYSGSKKR